MRLVDPGFRASAYIDRVLQATRYDTFMLTFKPEAGIWPQDWFIAYAQPSTHEVRALVSSVSFDQRPDAPGRLPQAVIYEKFETISGVLVPSVWSFWLWEETRGVLEPPLGTATLTDIKFVAPPSGAFIKPDGAARVE